MPKNLLQDMVRVKTPIRKVREEEVFPIKINKKQNKYRIYFVALVSIIFLLFALSFLFSGAEINLSPKMKELNLKNYNLSATKDSSTSTLSFDLVVISGEENKKIEGEKEKDVIEKATGTILIYNSFSSSPQTFAVDTRLEGSNGKIYKINKKITVPGKSIGDKPGSIEASIYGAEAGEEYNSGPIDFRFASFKGTPKYSKFYARSKGDIIGGFKGKSADISSLDKLTIVDELKATLETKLLKKATDQIPNGFILFKDAIFLDIEDKNISFTPSTDKMIDVSIKGTLYGFLFNENKLTKKIAEDSIDKYDGGDIYIPNIRDLIFSLNDKENISFAEIKDINFILSGTPIIISKINKNKFIADILGKKKKDFNQILTQYPDINSAEIVVRPFWKTSFPEKSDSIKVNVNYPK